MLLRRRPFLSVSSPPKGHKQASMAAPAHLERSKDPGTPHFSLQFFRKFPAFHLRLGSLVTYGCVCGSSLGILSCPQSLVSSSAPPPCLRLPVLPGSCMPISMPISPPRHPLACQSSPVPAHTVYPGASLHSSSLSSGAFPKPCIFLSAYQPAVVTSHQKEGVWVATLPSLVSGSFSSSLV